MSEMRSVSGILDVIKNITSNHESGRLEIISSGTRGTLLFTEGKLVDARLGSLSGFPTVNAAVALRDVQVSFDHVTPAAHLSTITQSERVVLKRFFGIEAAEMGEPAGTPEPEIDWNPAPEPVVPLNQAATLPLAFFSAPRLAVCLVLLIGLAVGAIALRSKLKASQTSAVASVVASQTLPGVETQLDVPQVTAAPEQRTAEVQPVAAETEERIAKVPDVTSQPEKRAAKVPEVTAQPEERTAKVRQPAAEPEKRAAKVQDLTGEWQVINTVQKTAYKSFDNLKVGFRLKINQRGKEFTGKGEKFFENGQTLSARSRTPIHVTGSIDGDKVVATFVEDGRMRRTNGRFVWKLQNGGDQLAGTFVSTAANSSGRSAMKKQ